MNKFRISLRKVYMIYRFNKSNWSFKTTVVPALSEEEIVTA
jgi:hypothetical protein